MDKVWVRGCRTCLQSWTGPVCAFWKNEGLEVTMETQIYTYESQKTAMVALATGKAPKPLLLGEEIIPLSIF